MLAARSHLTAQHLVGVGGMLGISSACIARPCLNGMASALYAGDSRTAAAVPVIAAFPTPVTVCLRASLLPRMPASGSAAAMPGHRGGNAGTHLPRPALGASTRFVSTAATAAEMSAAVGNPAAATVVPSAVVFKVGDGGHWSPFEDEKLLRMNRSNLLEALADSRMFALKLKDVDLSACSIAVVKNSLLPAGVTVPPVAFETGKAVVVMEGAKTMGDMAKEVGANGAPLFVCVGLPGRTALAAVATPKFVHDSAKKFTVNGAIEPISGGQFFHLSPDVSAMIELFDARTFFLLHGPRASGKTTTALHALAAAREHGYYSLNVDLSGLTHDSVESFWRELGHRLCARASEWKLKLQPISSGSTFQGAFSQFVLGVAKVIIMFDEFDALETSAPGVKESLLGVINAIKQNKGSSAIWSIFAAGPFNILSMDGKRGSPFNENLSAPLFTEEQVTQLLEQFATARGLMLEDGIATDIHRLTSGHAGFVCACGKALDTAEKVDREAGRISIAAWRSYSTRGLQTDLLSWPTVARMVKNVAALPTEPRQLLETAIQIHALQLRGRMHTVLEAAVILASEGWLQPVGRGRSADTFTVTSPLVRSLALHALAQLEAAPSNPSEPRGA